MADASIAVKATDRYSDAVKKMATVTKRFSKDADRQARKSDTDGIRVFMQLALLDCQTFEKLFKGGFKSAAFTS